MICEDCGNVAQLLSFDEMCADCEHKAKIKLQKFLQSRVATTIYMQEVFDELPKSKQAIMRHCDDCVFGKPSADQMHMSCLKYHRPRFFQPKSGDFTSGKWGWQRKCTDFAYPKVLEEELVKELLYDRV